MQSTLDRDVHRHHSRIAALKTDPGWAELEEALKLADERSWRRLSLDLKQGKEVLDTTIAEMRGTSKAIKLILDQPDRAARIIARENERKDSE